MVQGDLKVLISDPITGVLRLGLARPPTYVSGMDKLVQIVVLELLNRGGRSIFRPGAGGGLAALVGQNYDPDDPSELLSDLRVGVSSVEASIRAGQITTRRPPSERLARLEVVDLVHEEGSLGAEVVLLVVNEESAATEAQVAVA